MSVITTSQTDVITTSSTLSHGFQILPGNILIGTTIIGVQVISTVGQIFSNVTFTLYQNGIQKAQIIQSKSVSGLTVTHLFNGTLSITPVNEYDTFLITTSSNVNLRGDLNPSDSTTLFENPATGNLLYAEILYTEPEPVPCFTKTCNILTPNGYKNVTHLSTDDLVLTNDNRKVKITKIYQKTLKNNDYNQPYKIPAHFYGRNLPIIDTFISKYHVFNNGKKWTLPTLEKLNQEVLEEDEITYYNFKLENYHQDNLIVNGLTMESWDGKEPNEEKDFMWEFTKKGLVKKFY